MDYSDALQMRTDLIWDSRQILRERGRDMALTGRDGLLEHEHVRGSMKTKNTSTLS